MKIQMDAQQTDDWMDGQMDIQSETIIPSHNHVAGYKNTRWMVNSADSDHTSLKSI